MPFSVLQQQIAANIYQQAPTYGVDPNLALGIAWKEGLNSPTAHMAGNPDAYGTSYGPFQLFTGSPTALGSQFQNQYGALGGNNWRGKAAIRSRP
jgi:hypothetical protein